MLSLRFPFLFSKWYSLPVKQQLISHLSPARKSNPRTRCPGYILFEHTPFQVKLINLFITWAASLPNHRVRNESANRTASGAFVWEGQVCLYKLLWKCILNWICEASEGWIGRLPQSPFINQHKLSVLLQMWFTPKYEVCKKYYMDAYKGTVFVTLTLQKPAMYN